MIMIENAGPRATVHLSGRFDFECVLPFRQAVRPVLEDPQAETVVVDFANVTYVDSSGLGILLLLREQAGERSKAVVLARCSSDLQRILAIAQFDRLFRIEK